MVAPFVARCMTITLHTSHVLVSQTSRSYLIITPFWPIFACRMAECVEFVGAHFKSYARHTPVQLCRWHNLFMIFLGRLCSHTIFLSPSLTYSVPRLNMDIIFMPRFTSLSILHCTEPSLPKQYLWRMAFAVNVRLRDTFDWVLLQSKSRWHTNSLFVLSLEPFSFRRRFCRLRNMTPFHWFEHFGKARHKNCFQRLDLTWHPE